MWGFAEFVNIYLLCWQKIVVVIVIVIDFFDYDYDYDNDHEHRQKIVTRGALAPKRCVLRKYPRKFGFVFRP